MARVDRNPERDAGENRVRGAVKLVLFAKVTALAAVAHLPVPLLRLVGLRHRAVRVSAWVFRNWARWSARILGARIEVEGSPPSPPFVLASNHLGYVDIMVLASQINCVFISRADVAAWPVVGYLVRMVGTIFIDREAKRDIPRVLDLVDENLAHGRGIVIFPEGTTSDGSTVLRFQPALLEAAARSGIPVRCVSLTYRTPTGSAPANLAVCWWGDMTFWAHVLRLFRLPGFVAKVSFAPDSIRETDRKRLAAAAREIVLRHFDPIPVSNNYNGRTSTPRTVGEDGG
jgi:1-acyl-sn-glycerol-3-phosphate acyltransferase